MASKIEPKVVSFRESIAKLYRFADIIDYQAKNFSKDFSFITKKIVNLGDGNRCRFWVYSSMFAAIFMVVYGRFYDLCNPTGGYFIILLVSSQPIYHQIKQEVKVNLSRSLEHQQHEITVNKSKPSSTTDLLKIRTELDRKFDELATPALILMLSFSVAIFLAAFVQVFPHPKM